MTDLIKREDALAAIDTFKRDFEQSWKVQFSADIKALPAVTVLPDISLRTRNLLCKAIDDLENDRGVDLIELERLCILAASQPIDPVAIREAALREAADVARKLGVWPELNIWGGGPEWYQHGKRIANAIEALIGETK